MLMYPKEYLEFSQLIKEFVVLKIMLKVLEYDKNIIKQQSSCKLSNVYYDSLNYIQEKVEKDLRLIKRNMKELGGNVIEEIQQPTVRIVTAKFRGFTYTHRFLNYVLQSESEQLFKTYLVK